MIHIIGRVAGYTFAAENLQNKTYNNHFKPDSDTNPAILTFSVYKKGLRHRGCRIRIPQHHRYPDR